MDNFKHEKCDWRDVSKWKNIRKDGEIGYGICLNYKNGRYSGMVNDVSITITKTAKTKPRTFFQELLNKKPIIDKILYGLYVRKNETSKWSEYYTLYEDVEDESLKNLYHEIKQKFHDDKNLEKELTINKICGNITHD